MVKKVKLIRERRTKMPVVQMSPKGQILIPKRLREKYGVRPGAKVQLLEGPEGIVIRTAPQDPIAAACGFLEGSFSLTADLVEEHRKECDRE
jgi:AbrB family looped-hinge helix DNA binding protein